MRPRLSPFAHNLLFAGTLATVFALALYLRLSGIDTRPMHSDEAVQAYRVGIMLAGETFVYDPQDFHGPTLYFFTFWLCKIFGVGSFSELTETFVRAVPALIGALGCILIPLSFFGKRISSVALAGCLLACSHVAIFYSGYFIQETILVTFAWCAAGIWFFRKKTLTNAALAGICAGLAIASKETWILMAAAFAIGGAAMTLLRIRFREPGEPAKQLAKRFAVATLAAGIVATLFYSSFGQNPGGMADFFVAFKNYFFAGSATESPHAKPFSYYLLLLYRNSGWLLFWAALLGVNFLLRTFFPTKKERKFQCMFNGKDFSKILFVFATALSLLILYSAIPYKTPWCVLGIIPGIALLPLAASDSRVLMTVREEAGAAVRSITALLIFGGLLLLSFFSFLSSEQNGSVNLYYEHSRKEISKIVSVIEKSKADFVANGNDPETFYVALTGPEYWPLPWYLRRERFGAWDSIDAVPTQAPVIIASVDDWAEADACDTTTKKSRTIFCAGLRPGVIIEARENFSEAN